MSPVALQTTVAAVLRAPKDLVLEDRVLYRPPSGSCQLRVVTTGLCGSDRMFFPPLLFTTPPHLLSAQSITTNMVGMAILQFGRLSCWATKPPASSPMLAQTLPT